MDLDIIISTWGNMALGIALIVLNLPIFFAVILDGKLRQHYAVLSAVLLSSVLIGISCTAKGVNRYFVSLGAASMNDLFECYKNPAVVFDVIVYPLHSIELLVSSVDRLLVVIFPVKYFIHPKRFFISQLLIAHIFFIIISLGTVIVALLFYRTKIISSYCRQSESVPGPLFSMQICMRAALSSISIVVMLVVHYCLRLRIKKDAQVKRRPEKIKDFIKRQNGYTKAMLASSAFTFVLYIVPSLVGFYSHIANWTNRSTINTYATLIGYTDSLNEAIVVVYRQPDIRARLARLFGVSVTSTKNSTRQQHGLSLRATTRRVSTMLKAKQWTRITPPKSDIDLTSRT